MSYLGELDPAGWEQRVAEQKAGYSPPPPETPGFFEGSLRATGAGIMKGGANAADFLMTAFGKSPAMSDEQERINEIADRMQEEQVSSAKEFWTPDPRTIGTAGRVLGGFGEMVLPLIAGGGDPALLVGSNTLAAGKEQIDAGVDAQTAGINAAFAGAGTYAGFKVPIVGNTLTQRMVSGAIGNTVVNAGITEAQRATLQSRGYDELAQNYDPLDVEARAVDLLTGLAFGATHHLASPRQRSAAAAANNAKHYQADTAPGIPENAVADAAHLRAMATATEQLVTGEPVSVPEDVTQAAFRERPERTPPPIPEELVAFDAARAETVKSDAADQGGGYDVAEGVLTDEQRAAFANLGRTGDGSVALSGSAEVLPGADRRGSASAGETTTEVFRGSNADLAGEHFADPALGFASEHPSAGSGVWFTTSAEEAARYGSKVSAHQLAFKKLKAYDAGDFPAFDSLEEAKAFRRKLIAEGYDGIHLKNSQVGGADHYVAFGHEQVRKPGSIAKQKAEPVAKPKTAEPAAPVEKAAAQEDPHVTVAREHLATADVKVPTGGFDAEGNPEVRSARELLAEADAEVANAETMGQGIAAAVSCFLTRGA